MLGLRFPHVGIFSGLLLVTIWAVSYSSTPKVKTFRTQQDFESGELVAVSVHPDGNLTLAPLLSRTFESGQAAVWTSIADAKGLLYVAGGNTGKVFKLDKEGAGELAFEAPEIQVYAMARAGNGDLFVATSPRGKVYRILPNATNLPEQTVFFEPEELYIWSMAIDARSNLYVATGELGRIYRVDQQGRASLFYESEDAHVRKIAFDHQGNLLAGTANKGLVLKISASGKAFVLYDSPLTEITDLLEMPDGNIFAAATGDSPLPVAIPLPGNKPESESENGGDQKREDVETEVALQQAGAVAVRRGRQTGDLYRIDPDGNVRTFQMLKSERIYSLARSAQGELLVGAGDEGRLYALNADGDVTLLTTVDEMQITFLAPAASGEVLVGTSNSGNLYRLNSVLGDEGYFVSEVIDATVSSKWGAVHWEAGQAGSAGISIQTRSGNTAEPDQTWSEWSGRYTNELGQNITSPPARFIQIKATLTRKAGQKAPELYNVSLSYLQKNVAPQIQQVKVHTPGEYYPDSPSQTKTNRLAADGEEPSNGFQNNSVGRKLHRKGFRSVSWVALDNNGDKMSYDLYYKGTDETVWKTLAVEMLGVVYSWDSELMPDGRYEIKLVAKDDLSNPPDMVLSSDKVSQPFVIDNSGPQVSELAVKSHGKKITLSFSVQDKLSPVESVEFAVNAEDWKLVYPDDGICDSKRESFTMELPGPVAKEATFVIKATDAIGNVGFGKRLVKL